MNNIIPFESTGLPAHIASLFQVEKLGVVGGGGYPIISIKGKVFTKVQGDDREIIKKPGEDDPAASIDVVIVKQNPNRSKVFYPKGYTEGSDEKPACYSNNGVEPEKDAVEPQAKKCAVCQHNQWGSRITETGGKGKACSDSQRIAVVPLGLLNDPMLIRVPAASLKVLDAYGDSLAKRNVPYQLVVTKIGFDYSVAHPALTFKALGFIDEGSAKEVFETSKSSVADQIIGVVPTFESPVSGELPAPDAPDQKAEEPVKTKAKAKVEEPPAETAVEAPAKAVEKEVVTKPVQSVIEVDSSLAGEISSLMDSLDFEDDE